MDICCFPLPVCLSRLMILTQFVPHLMIRTSVSPHYYFMWDHSLTMGFIDPRCRLSHHRHPHYCLDNATKVSLSSRLHCWSIRPNHHYPICCLHFIHRHHRHPYTLVFGNHHRHSHPLLPLATGIFDILEALFCYFYHICQCFWLDHYWNRSLC